MRIRMRTACAVKYNLTGAVCVKFFGSTRLLLSSGRQRWQGFCAANRVSRKRSKCFRSSASNAALTCDYSLKLVASGWTRREVSKRWTEVFWSFASALLASARVFRILLALGWIRSKVLGKWTQELSSYCFVFLRVAGSAYVAPVWVEERSVGRLALDSEVVAMSGT